MIHFINIAEEHANIQEADDLLKLAYKLDHNSTLELEIEWYNKNKTEWRRSRSFESSKFMQAVPFKSFTHSEICT